MRKESLRKNAVVLTVLVLVGAAVFINWKFSPPAETANGAVSGEESGRKLLGQSTLVSGEGDSSADPAGEDAVYTGTDYFASARLTRQHNDANMMALGAGVVGEKLALEMVDVFLNTPFSEGERHARRVAKVNAIQP